MPIRYLSACKLALVKVRRALLRLLGIKPTPTFPPLDAEAELSPRALAIFNELTARCNAERRTK